MTAEESRILWKALDEVDRLNVRLAEAEKERDHFKVEFEVADEAIDDLECEP